MTEAEARAHALAFLEAAGVVLLGTVDAEGYPHAKSMPLLRLDGLNVAWFATKTSTNRVARIRKNPKTCIYYCDSARRTALLLTGRAEVLTDRASRQAVWRDGFERVYKRGLDDPEFAVIRFRTLKVSLTVGRETITFPL